jgi:hypothetical protein
MHVTQAFAETGQTVDRAFACIIEQIALRRKTLGQSYCFANAIEDGELAMAQLADNHVKTVGAEIDGSDDFWLVCLRR